MDQETQLTEPPLSAPAADVALLHELVDHLRHHRTALREEWVRRITDAQLLRVMTPGDLLRGDGGLRQLRRRPRDGQRRDPAGVRA